MKSTVLIAVMFSSLYGSEKEQQESFPLLRSLRRKMRIEHEDEQSPRPRKNPRTTPPESPVDGAREKEQWAADVLIDDHLMVTYENRELYRSSYLLCAYYDPYDTFKKKWSLERRKE